MATSWHSSCVLCELTALSCLLEHHPLQTTTAGVGLNVSPRATRHTPQCLETISPQEALREGVSDEQRRSAVVRWDLLSPLSTMLFSLAAMSNIWYILNQQATTFCS